MDKKILLSAGIAGAVLMSMEIAASRMLVPQFGDSLAVWGSLIGIVLIALSIGYHLGGVFADKYPKKEGIAILLLCCSITVLCIPLFGFILPMIARMPTTIGVIIGSSLFIIPSILLGAITPYCVRITAKDIKHIGLLSGNISAASTVGSVIGTFATTFVLTLILPTTQIFLLLFGVCLATAGLLWRGWKVFLAIIIGGLIIFSLVFAQSQKIESAGNLSITLHSPYGDVRVWDDQGIRRISISGGKMSAMNISDPLAVPSAWDFIGCMDGALMLQENIESALTIGIGGGLHQRRLADIYNIEVDAVDINPAVVELANKYFMLEENPAITTYVGDGRRFLAQSEKKYDLISLDVVQYNNFSYRMPFHLATQEFFLVAKKHLSDEGVLMHHVLSNRENAFFTSIVTTLNAEFDYLYALDCDGSQILLATDAATIPRANNNHQQGLLEKFYNPESSGSVLTDDFAPINPFAEAVVVEK